MLKQIKPHYWTTQHLEHEPQDSQEYQDYLGLLRAWIREGKLKTVDRIVTDCIQFNYQRALNTVFDQLGVEECSNIRERIALYQLLKE